MKLIEGSEEEHQLYTSSTLLKIFLVIQCSKFIASVLWHMPFFVNLLCYCWTVMTIIWTNGCLFLQTVQKALLQSDVQSKSDKSPVTVADYGMPSNLL